MFLLTLSLGLAGCSGQQVLNTLERDGGNEVATNIVFDDATGLRLDIYTPRASRDAATIVFFYSGRWTTGSKDDFKFVGQVLASQGFVVVIPDYRKYPQVRYPEFVQDGAAAVKWVSENIRRYGGSRDNLFVMGHSSGAHIAAMLALDAEFLTAVDLSPEIFRGMIGLAGPYDFMPITDPDLRDIFGPPENFERSQPITYVDGRNPPLFLVHGDDDDSVWVKNTRNLARAVAKAGGAVETLIFPKLAHHCAVAGLTTAAAIACGKPDILPQVTQFVRQHSR
jgi:acetyl esterase/lipase